MKRFESRCVVSSQFVRVLDFNGMEAVGAVNYEVNFDTCFRAPEKELVAAAAVVVPGGEMLEDETFQAGPVDFAWTVQ